MALAVAEVLANGTRSIGSNVLHRSRIRSRSRNDDGVFHRAVIVEGLDDRSDRRALLPDSAVDTDEVASFAVDDGVERDGRFASLAVADDQFALTAANRNH